ncbi:hypothetical protein [Mesorhizobium sp. B1-1-8]|uniref:hypothetical protein n=1 Tax=Mesorhizobium sp. B1-1-8 TaxID=2589976 RepID=UPI001128B426|nr:hypothetical protein [Mesorhizobium sp. B1-1-8]UCI07369.1 hypothetical protein FJ974_26895 [Mesorhizobium sp. B1-1-8]
MGVDEECPGSGINSRSFAKLITSEQIGGSNMLISADNLGTIVSSIGALGTAAFGLVDATKVYRGGVSNIGFGFIRDAVTPYKAALKLVNKSDPLATIRANWLNGVSKSDQKATVKSLIRLGLTATTVDELAAAAPGVNAGALKTASSKVDSAQPLTEDDINVLGRFDTIVDAQMDASFERADQKYRNSAKVLAAGFAIALAVLAIGVMYGYSGEDGTSNFLAALLIGIVSTPVAPIAKDLASALGIAVSAMKAAKG